jgi:hypothetical protein
MGLGVGSEKGLGNINQAFIMSRFQFNAKSAFLTYPQLLNVTNDRVKEDYLVFTETLGVNEYCIGLEKHTEGGIHLHCFLSWTTNFRSRNTRCFDFNGNHPNIQNPRNRKQVIEYCRKEGDFLSNIQSTTSKRSYGELLQECGSSDDFLKGMEECKSRDFVIFNKRIKEFATERWPRNAPDYVPTFTTFDIPTSLNEWVTEELRIIKGTCRLIIYPGS